jgi:hypothetical protein
MVTLKRFKRSALRCKKSDENYGSFVALALSFILIKPSAPPRKLRSLKTTLQGPAAQRQCHEVPAALLLPIGILDEAPSCIVLRWLRRCVTRAVVIDCETATNMYAIAKIMP